MPSLRSTRPSGPKERRSSAFVREDSGRTSGSLDAGNLRRGQVPHTTTRPPAIGRRPSTELESRAVQVRLVRPEHRSEDAVLLVLEHVVAERGVLERERVRGKKRRIELALRRVLQQPVHVLLPACCAVRTVKPLFMITPTGNLSITP